MVYFCTLLKLPPKLDEGVYYEVRLDRIGFHALKQFEDIRQRVLLTYRGSENRREMIKQMAAWKPGFLDLEPGDYSQTFRDSHFIFSYHLDTAPEFNEGVKWAPSHSVERFFEAMHGMRHLRFACYVPQGQGLDGWRIAAHHLLGGFTFVAPDDGGLSYQPKITEIVDHYSHAKKGAPLFALLGDPVDQSLSHVIHNQFFKDKEINALYVKLKLEEKDLPLFLKKAWDLPFLGFSVTMPLKEVAAEYATELDLEAKRALAGNTLIKTKRGWKLYNLDGPAAIDLIPNCKKLLVYGSGGVAACVIATALNRGIEVEVMARNHEKAKKLAKEFKINFRENFHDCDADTLFQATPSFRPFNFEDLPKGIRLFDAISVPEKTPLLLFGEARGWPIVTGRAMLLAQAKMQQALFVKIIQQAQAQSEAFCLPKDGWHQESLYLIPPL